MVSRAVTPWSTTEDAPWECAHRKAYREEGHRRGEQNLPTMGQSADSHGYLAMPTRAL